MRVPAEMGDNVSKDKRIYMRATEEELAELQQAAQTARSSLSTYVMVAALERARGRDDRPEPTPVPSAPEPVQKTPEPLTEEEEDWGATARRPREDVFSDDMRYW